MASPGSFAAGGVLTAAEMNALPSGIVSAVTNSSDVSLSVSQSVINSITFTTVSGRKYLALASAIVDNVSTTLLMACRIYQDATAVGYVQQICDSTYDRFNNTMFAVFTGTGASETIEHRMNTSTGTATAEGTTFPSQFVIFDIGV